MMHATRTPRAVQGDRHHVEADRARKQTPLRQPPGSGRSEAPGLLRPDGLKGFPIFLAGPGLDLNDDYLRQSATYEIQLTERRTLILRQQPIAPFTKEEGCRLLPSATP
jgi:hypothetical protein